MILRELISTKASDTAGFFGLQAEESIRWLTKMGVTAMTHPKALDLGCGFGFLGYKDGKLAIQGTSGEVFDRWKECATHVGEKSIPNLHWQNAEIPPNDRWD